MKHRVRNIGGKFYPEAYDEDLGWVGYSVYEKFLKFDRENDAWTHINKYPNKLQVMNCD